MEERAEREAEAGVGGRDCIDRGVVELRAPLGALPALEQPHMVAVERSPRSELASDRQIRVDGSHVRDRGLFQVERRRVLAAVRDLEDCSRSTILEHECLVSLAAELRSAAVDTEQLRGDLGGFVGGEPRRCRVEDGTHDIPIVFGG
jgi:hypothetical protein